MLCCKFPVGRRDTGEGKLNVAKKERTIQAAVGLRVKSGWATAVLVVGSVNSPRAISRSVVDLSDEGDPDSRQPYHAVMGLNENDGPKLLKRLEKVVERVTNKSVTDLLKDYRNTGSEVRAAGLVVGSTVDPSSIPNDHIRAHALEGHLFRTALESALHASGLPFSVVVEREAYSKAVGLLGRSSDDVKQVLSELGRQVGGPWRSDEKMAALVAWMALA
ncbi:MAG: hypothetical protein DMF61_17430 [Blastocatellia bacterium AA13]|nr:MAG: hypothetical protein DMF61_17430 [Blastocatellia bacterium AA13]